MGIDDHQEVLFLGVYCDAEGNLIDRPLPSDCVGDFNKCPLRWKDMKHARRQRTPTNTGEKYPCGCSIGRARPRGDCPVNGNHSQFQ